MRRVLSFLLSLVLIMSLFTVPVSAAGGQEGGGGSFQWNNTDPGNGNERRGLDNRGGINLDGAATLIKIRLVPYSELQGLTEDGQSAYLRTVQLENIYNTEVLNTSDIALWVCPSIDHNKWMGFITYDVSGGNSSSPSQTRIRIR